MPTQVASPSMPSIKFKALMAPNSQNSVKGIAKTPSSTSNENKWMLRTTSPPATSAPTATN